MDSAVRTLAQLLYVAGVTAKDDSLGLAYALITVMAEEGYSIVPTEEVSTDV